VIETPRLLLRSPTQRDRVILAATGSDAAAQRWLGWRPEEVVTDEHREHLLASRPGAGPMTRPSAWLDLLVIDKASGMAAGGASVELQEIPEIGGHLAPRFRGRGLGAELFAGVALFAHQHLGIRTVRAVAESGNTGSIKSLEAAGFRPADGALTYTLPNGNVVLSFWFRHEAAAVGVCRCGDLTLTAAAPGEAVSGTVVSRTAVSGGTGSGGTGSGGTGSGGVVSGTVVSGAVALGAGPPPAALSPAAPFGTVPPRSAPPWPDAPMPATLRAASSLVPPGNPGPPAHGTEDATDPALDSPGLAEALAREADS
jgi:RimJ/RimL family protein N-acetyltransferase